MTIHEFLDQFEPEETTVQWLHEAITHWQAVKKGGSKVTFWTDQLSGGEVASGDMGRCLIVWFDKNAWERAKQARAVLAKATK